MPTTDDRPPPPGSDEAISIGCRCARIDNRRGRGYMGIPGVFVYRLDCPVHGEAGGAGDPGAGRGGRGDMTMPPDPNPPPSPPMPPTPAVDLVAFLAAWSISAMFPDPWPPSRAEGVLFGMAADEMRGLRAERAVLLSRLSTDGA